MKKSELIKHLQNNLDKYGDGEIKVEVLTDLNSRGKDYEIEDITNAVGFEFEMDYITVFEKECVKEGNIDKDKLLLFLDNLRTSFLQDRDMAIYLDTQEYCSGMADGLLNVMEYLNGNKEYLSK